MGVVGLSGEEEDDVMVPINSCLRLLCACDGLQITTVEGFGNEKDGFSDVQQAIADFNGSQCGFCKWWWGGRGEGGVGAD